MTQAAVPLITALPHGAMEAPPRETIKAPLRARASATSSAVLGEPTVTAHDAIYSLVTLLRQAGCTSQAISDHTGIHEIDLDNPDARVTIGCFNQLWKFAEVSLGNPAIGLDLTGQYPANHMHFLAHMAVRCATIREGIALWRTHARLVSDIETVDYDDNATSARFIYRCLNPRYATHYGAEHYVSLALFYARTFCGEDLAVELATFTHPAPEHAAHYAEVFGAPVQFGAPENSLVFPRRYLDQPFKSADPYLGQFLARRASEMLAELDRSVPTSTLVAQATEIMMARGDVLTLDATSQRLGMTGRRLRQALQNENTSYREVLAQVRKEAAVQYLQQGMNVSQIALLLGFSEASAFHHAFKRWFDGRSPASFLDVSAGLTANRR